MTEKTILRYMRIHQLYALFLFSLSTSLFYGQDSLQPVRKDSSLTPTLFRNTKLDLKFRNYFMNTLNESGLKDDYALASGLSLGILTPDYRGFQIGLSASVTYNVNSSNLVKVDASTLGNNRYEQGLFDLRHPDKKLNLYRFENLFLAYHISKSELTLGRMKLNTPFLNQQDGRMNVTMEEGIWLKTAEVKNMEFCGGWLWKISPRSTTQWFHVGEAIGINPVGVNAQGTKSEYADQLNSQGIALAGFGYKVHSTLKLSLWDMWIENIVNTNMLELNYEDGKELKFYQGFMYVHQDAVCRGGNSDPQKSYLPAGAQSNAFSGQTGLKSKRFNTSLNYTHITGDGRYLSPREFGREPFYTLMLRERNEGLGKVYAISTKTYFYSKTGRLKIGGGYGYYLLPDVKDYRLNKYGLPSYHHFNFDITYSFANFLKGLEVRSISTYKKDEGETYNDLKYIYNKVNMFNFSLIVDYKF